MSQRSVVDLIEDYQTGVFVLIGCLVVGIVLAYAFGLVAGTAGTVAGFVGGALLAFLAYSYLRYGR